MKKQILLPTKKFFKSPEEDLSVPLKLEDNSKLLREGDRDIVLNISELFDYERNQSINYKIYGKLRMVFRNMYSGSTLNTAYNYEPIKKFLYPTNENISLTDGFLPYDEFAFIRKDVLYEVNETGQTTNTINLKLKGTEYTGHTVTTNMTAPYKNWNLYLSYVYGSDNNFPMMYTLTGNTFINFKSGDGIPFRVENNGNKYTLTCPVEHGMKEGEYITLYGSGLTGNASGRTFSISSVGNEVYNSEKYVINFSSGLNITDKILIGKRCLDINNIDATTSKYYVHKHKIITNVGDYAIDNAGFERTIWEEEKKLLNENALNDEDILVQRNRMETLIYDFKNPIVLSGITNNLGYTPTEVYVSVIFKNGNGYFDYQPKVGYKFHFHDTWIDTHFSGDGSKETGITQAPIVTNTSPYTNSFTGGTSLVSGSTLTGAFVEYNESELKERIISETFHKITIRKDIFDHGQTDTNNFSGASTNNPFGLFYQPHYRVKLRQLSPYVETSTTNEIFNLPENTRYNELEKLWKWRDLYDHGYIDPDGFGTNYPFTNNTHYVKNDINFYLRNEQIYTNKSDGLTSFDNTKLKVNC